MKKVIEGNYKAYLNRKRRNKKKFYVSDSTAALSGVERRVECKANVRIKIYNNGEISINHYERYIKLGCQQSKSISESKAADVKAKKVVDYEINPFTNHVEFKHEKKVFKQSSKDKWDSFQRSKKKIYDIAKNNKWDYFFTLTASDEDERNDLNLFKKRLGKRMNNLKTKYPELKYLFVFEKFKKGGYHAHGLVSGLPDCEFVRAVNNKKYYRGKKNKYYLKNLTTDAGDPIFNCLAFNSFGFNNCTRVKNTHAVARYIVKYLTKEFCDSEPCKSRYVCSKGLGNIKTHYIDVYDGDVYTIYNALGLDGPDYVKPGCITIPTFCGNKDYNITYTSKKLTKSQIERVSKIVETLDVRPPCNLSHALLCVGR